jgi:hypothetical protein
MRVWPGSSIRIFVSPLNGWQDLPRRALPKCTAAIERDGIMPVGGTGHLFDADKPARSPALEPGRLDVSWPRDTARAVHSPSRPRDLPGRPPSPAGPGPWGGADGEMAGGAGGDTAGGAGGGGCSTRIGAGRSIRRGTSRAADRSGIVRSNCGDVLGPDGAVGMALGWPCRGNWGWKSGVIRLRVGGVTMPGRVARSGMRPSESSRVTGRLYGLGKRDALGPRSPRGSIV